MAHPAPSWPAVLSSWTPWSVLVGTVVLVTLVASVGYLHKARRAEGWPLWRSACWLLAMAVLLISVIGPVGVYGEILFWVHMVQHLLMIMVVPALVVWAQPLRLLGSRIDGLVHGRVLRWSTGPLVGLALYTAVVVLTHLTGFQQLAATHGWLRAAELTLYLVSGWLFLVPLIGSERGPWSLGSSPTALPYLLRFVLLALGMGADTLTGVVLMMTSRPLAPVYAETHPGWGPSALADQHTAGGIMWFGGDLLMMAFMILVAIQWGRDDPERQGMGAWLEAARRRTLLGSEPAGSENITDIDEDQRALDAYNATLAALHGRRPDPDHQPDQRRPR